VTPVFAATSSYDVDAAIMHIDDMNEASTPYDVVRAVPQ